MHTKHHKFQSKRLLFTKIRLHSRTKVENQHKLDTTKLENRSNEYNDNLNARPKCTAKSINREMQHKKYFTETYRIFHTLN